MVSIFFSHKKISFFNEFCASIERLDFQLIFDGITVVIDISTSQALLGFQSRVILSMLFLSHFLIHDRIGRVLRIISLLMSDCPARSQNYTFGILTGENILKFFFIVVNKCLSLALILEVIFWFRLLATH